MTEAGPAAYKLLQSVDIQHSRGLRARSPGRSAGGRPPGRVLRTSPLLPARPTPGHGQPWQLGCCTSIPIAGTPRPAGTGHQCSTSQIQTASQTAMRWRKAQDASATLSICLSSYYNRASFGQEQGSAACTQAGYGSIWTKSDLQQMLGLTQQAATCADAGCNPSCMLRAHAYMLPCLRS